MNSVKMEFSVRGITVKVYETLRGFSVVAGNEKHIASRHGVQFNDIGDETSNTVAEVQSVSM